jgi:esterase/lipase
MGITPIRRHYKKIVPLETGTRLESELVKIIQFLKIFTSTKKHSTENNQDGQSECRDQGEFCLAKS